MVGASKQFLQRGLSGSIEPRDAEACSNENLPVIENAGFIGEIRPQALDGMNDGLLVSVRHDEQKFVPTQSSSYIRSARVGFQNRSETLDCFVSGEVTIGVVHEFEFV